MTNMKVINDVKTSDKSERANCHGHKAFYPFRGYSNYMA